MDTPHRVSVTPRAVSMKTMAASASALPASASVLAPTATELQVTCLEAVEKSADFIAFAPGAAALILHCVPLSVPRFSTAHKQRLYRRNDPSFWLLIPGIPESGGVDAN